MAEKSGKSGPDPIALELKRRNRGALLLNDAEFADLNAQCQRLGIPMARYVRGLIVAACGSAPADGGGDSSVSDS